MPNAVRISDELLYEYNSIKEILIGVTELDQGEKPEYEFG